MADTVDREVATVPTEDEDTVDRSAATVDTELVSREDATKEIDDESAALPEIVFFTDTKCDKKLLKGIPDNPVKLTAGKSMIFGRGEVADVFLNDDTASRSHMKLTPAYSDAQQNMVYVIETISLTKKVFINGKGFATGQKHILRSQDKVSIGKLEFTIAIRNGNDKDSCLVRFESTNLQNGYNLVPVAGVAQNGLGMPAVIAGVQNINIGGGVSGQQVPQAHFIPSSNIPMGAGPQNMFQVPLNTEPMGGAYGAPQMPHVNMPQMPASMLTPQILAQMGQPVAMPYLVPSMGPGFTGPSMGNGPYMPGFGVGISGPGMGVVSPGIGVGPRGLAQESMPYQCSDMDGAQARRDAYKHQAGGTPSENSEDTAPTNLSVEEGGLPKGQSFEETHPPKE